MSIPMSMLIKRSMSMLVLVGVSVDVDADVGVGVDLCAASGRSPIPAWMI